MEVRGGRMSASVHMVSWFEEGDVSWLRSLSPDRIVAIDVETTGLDPEVDEIGSYFSVLPADAGMIPFQRTPAKTARG